MSRSMSPSSRRPAILSLLLCLQLAGCAVGPDYRRPDSAAPAGFKEPGATDGWVGATPADAADRGAWWAVFGDPLLDGLAAQVEVSNQNVAAAAAAYAQARALVREQRAALFPVVTLDGAASRSGTGARSGVSESNGVVSAGSSGRRGNTYQSSIGASWEPDVWGRLSRTEANAAASAQASAADLASARLSAQGELVVDYIALRQADAQAALLQDTIAAYQRALEITTNRYTAGINPKSDVLQAQTQLYNAQADAVDLQRQRAQMEHAIAVLIGKAPADFSLAAAPWKAVVPEVPTGLPSTLLQRRPDIAGAERRVAAANEQIGIARSAFYPSLSLSASYGVSASRVGDLFNASSSLWSLGLSAAQTLFDAGATRERVAQAQAAYDATVARYRQAVLTAFQDVEDQLAAGRVLQQEQGLRERASRAADEAEAQALNRYRAGQVGYTDVVTAQASALSARRTLVQLMADRQTSAAALIQALGGGWHVQP